MNILFINACVRKESRTLVLAKNILSKMQGDIIEIDLAKENLAPLNRISLEERERLLKSREMDAPMFQYAKQFAQADEIVIAAPFWDLSFPSILKIYMEQITVAGITFEYRNGCPTGLCKAKRLIYVTTAGGEIFCDFGYEYINKYYTSQGKDKLSREDAEAVVLSYSAAPGQSEHQSGLCIDFITMSMSGLTNEQFEATAAFRWLRENACRFGFILRYPSDKTKVTGYSYESWHYRFVGREIAMEISQRGITLEEYLAGK